MTKLRSILLAGSAAALVTACGPDSIQSPGGSSVTITDSGNTTNVNNPPPSGPTGVTPDGSCPGLGGGVTLTNEGTIKGPTGEYRVCTLPTEILASVTLPKRAGTLYRLAGRTDVGFDQGPTSAPGDGEAAAGGGTRDIDTDSNGTEDPGVTLSIDPGVIIYASGNSWLAVNRGNKIEAVGTSTKPIIFTAEENIVGTATDTTSGEWGGVVLMGRAPITDCNFGVEQTITCARQVEGASDPALFGGLSPNDSSGTMSFVQIRYSGSALALGNELQSLTPSGVGSGTELNHIHTHNSSDDGAEFFGGVVGRGANGASKYWVLTGAEDDSFDLDTGVQGSFQYLIAIQRAGGLVGDSMMEVDSTNFPDRTPRTDVRIANATLVSRGGVNVDNDTMLRIRGGADYKLINSVMDMPDLTASGASTDYNCVRVDQAETYRPANAGLDDLGPPVFAGVYGNCDTSTKPFEGNPASGQTEPTNDQIAALFNSGTSNNSTFSLTLNVFVNGANEDAATAVNPQDYDEAGEFDATNYVGAARSTDSWYQGWTCDSSTASFNTGLSNAAELACTTLPTS